MSTPIKVGTYWRHNRNPGLVVKITDNNSWVDLPGRFFFRDISTGYPFMLDNPQEFHSQYTAITDEEELGLVLLGDLP